MTALSGGIICRDGCCKYFLKVAIPECYRQDGEQMKQEHENLAEMLD